uniref:Uncharacterized protein n=1 Tax=Candidatus Kentrum sp. LFY TaxID=2126342 RepID=A0A450X3T7_9GAMM|nr:MAG: hypothetical protein BECKLFY1418C_GA0070996_11602 [Candidatus Kentron sp. LFY]
MDIGTHLYRFLDGDSPGGIAVLFHQHLEVELPDDLFGPSGPFLAGGQTFEIRLAPFQEKGKPGNGLGLEDGRGVGRPPEDFIDGGWCFCRGFHAAFSFSPVPTRRAGTG